MQRPLFSFPVVKSGIKINMTHLFLAAVSSFMIPRRLLKIQPVLCPLPYLDPSRPVSVRWHSDTVRTLFCRAGPVRQDGAQMTQSHGPCGHRGALTKYGQAHSLLYHNRRGMQQLIIPPALPPGSKARLSSLVTDTQTVCCAAVPFLVLSAQLSPALLFAPWKQQPAYWLFLAATAPHLTDHRSGSVLRQQWCQMVPQI